MKKLIFALGLGLIIGMVNFNKAEAQVHVSINIDIQPAWGPSGYNYAEFYFIPEINVYYDVINHLYYYLNGRRWVSGMYLPMAYSHYDFYSLYKVVINGVRDPWRHYRNHVSLYSGYCYNYAQVPIFYVMEPRYHRARVNYHGWVEPRYMPRNNGRPHSNNFNANTRNGRINDSRSTPNNRRETISPRSTQRNATVDNRNSRSNNNDNRPIVSNRSSRDNRSNPAIGSRNNGNDNRNNLSSNSRINNDNKSNSSVGGRSNGNNNKNNLSSNPPANKSENKSTTTTRSRSGGNDNSSKSSIGNRNSNRNSDSSVRSRSGNSDKKPSSSTKERSSNRSENSRSGRR